MEFLFLVKEVILDESANIQNSFEEDQGIKWHLRQYSTWIISPSCPFHVPNIIPVFRFSKDMIPDENPTATHWLSGLTAIHLINPEKYIHLI